MSNTILSGKAGREKLTQGVNIVADAVKVTMGAKGRNVIYEDHTYNPQITKDGVTVANQIFLEDKAMNLGASLVKEAANKTVMEAGDGTSTTTVLVQAIINAGIIELNNGAHPILLKKGLEKASGEVIDYIKSVSKAVDSSEILHNIAAISANNDMEIGKVIADAVTSVGPHGIITLEKGTQEATIVETVEGMKIDSGYIDHQFQTDPSKMEANYEEPLILLFDGKIPSIQTILPIIEKVMAQQKPLVIIAEEISGDLLTILTGNKVKHALPLLPINSPGVGANKRFILEDIAAVTNAVIMDEKSIKEIAVTDLGRTSKIICNREQTTFIGGFGTTEEVKKRSDLIKSQIEVSKSDREKIFLSKRLAVMENGLAIIKVGGVTETEIGEKLDRFDDALRATRSAQEEGYVAGGGSTFVHASQVWIDAEDNTIEEYQTARTILIKALWSPFVQILDNAGADANEPLNLILNKGYGFGYDVNVDQIENMLDKGIIDPTKVLRVALKNAVSIASIFLTNEFVIIRRDI